MHIEDDYSWAEQTNLKNEADGLLASAYVAEFEDVADGEDRGETERDFENMPFLATKTLLPIRC